MTAVFCIIAAASATVSDEEDDEDDFGFPLHHAGVIQDVSMAYVDASMDAKVWDVD